MYGLVNRAVEQMVRERFGAERWHAIQARAGLAGPGSAGQDPHVLLGRQDGLGLGAASWTGSAWGGALGAALWTLSALDTPEALIVPGMALPWLLTLTPIALRRPNGLAPFALALCGLLLMIAPPLAAEALAGASS